MGASWGPGSSTAGDSGMKWMGPSILGGPLGVPLGGWSQAQLTLDAPSSYAIEEEKRQKAAADAEIARLAAAGNDYWQNALNAQANAYSAGTLLGVPSPTVKSIAASGPAPTKNVFQGSAFGSGSQPNYTQNTFAPKPTPAPTLQPIPAPTSFVPLGGGGAAPPVPPVFQPAVEPHPAPRAPIAPIAPPAPTAPLLDIPEVKRPNGYGWGGYGWSGNSILPDGWNLANGSAPPAHQGSDPLWGTAPTTSMSSPSQSSLTQQGLGALISALVGRIAQNNGGYNGFVSGYGAQPAYGGGAANQPNYAGLYQVLQRLAAMR